MSLAASCRLGHNLFQLRVYSSLLCVTLGITHNPPRGGGHRGLHLFLQKSPRRWCKAHRSLRGEKLGGRRLRRSAQGGTVDYVCCAAAAFSRQGEAQLVGAANSRRSDVKLAVREGWLAEQNGHAPQRLAL